MFREIEEGHRKNNVLCCKLYWLKLRVGGGGGAKPFSGGH